MDARYEILIALTVGRTVRVAGVRFAPTRGGRVAIHEPGRFLPTTADLFDAAMRAGEMAMAAAAFGG